MNEAAREHARISQMGVDLASTAQLQTHAAMLAFSDHSAHTALRIWAVDVTCPVFIHWETFRNKTQDSNLQP